MNLDDIIESINNKVNFDLRDRKRTLDYVGARCVYYDLAYNYFSLGTLSDIASHIGRDHTTAVHSLHKLLPTLDLYFPKMDQVRREIMGYNEYGDSYYDMKDEIEFLRDEINSVKNDKNNYIFNHNEDINEMFKMIKSVPDDKTSILKTRLKPIIYMLCK